MPDITLCRVAVVADDSVNRSVVMKRAIAALTTELESRSITVIPLDSYAEARPVLANDMDLDCVLLAVDPEAPPVTDPEQCLFKLLADRQSKVPLFLLADRAAVSSKINVELMQRGSEYIWIFEDSPHFVAGRIEAAIARYRAGLLPPLFRAIVDYNESHHEYSWAAPGHQGGVGFMKSPAGKKFYDFYGENLFRTDTGIERVSIGSLLDHSGAFHASEKRAAETFGADASFEGVVGTSGSNRTVMQSVLADGDVAICDRNCHKSIEQGLILSGARPVYLVPTRNRYGIIGPVPKSELSQEAVTRKLGYQPTGRLPYAVITNCTYDGICYRADAAEKLLEPLVENIHFDEAWYAYARFNPLYLHHYAMRGEPARHRSAATVFATHSTHKLLNALSQASYIHIRHARDRRLDFDRFNQAYMMHATTSPLYAISASNDVASEMMRESGESLTGEVISEAIDFRQNLARLERELGQSGSWFFKVWNQETVSDPGSRQKYAFADAPKALLVREQSCWQLNPGDTWHGFRDLDRDWVMLDPIKVSILSPGMGEDGHLQKEGVPAALVSAFLYEEGIVPTRTTDFQLMFLFSMGITRGKWGTLLNTLLRFKECYDRNLPVPEVLPQLALSAPGRYAKTGIHQLGDKMFDYLKNHTPGDQLNAAFAVLPEAAMTPRAAYMKIVRNEVEAVPSDRLAGRIAANSVIPYPPGIPMMMSGERFAAHDSPQIAYLHALEAWDHEFPGFEHETEGCEVIDGRYYLLCVREK